MKKKKKTENEGEDEVELRRRKVYFCLRFSIATSKSSSEKSSKTFSILIGRFIFCQVNKPMDNFTWNIMNYCWITYSSKRYFILFIKVSSITHFIMDLHSYFTEKPLVRIWFIGAVYP